MKLGAVLAGGASTRMGRDKALVEVGGRPMLELVAVALGEVVDRVVVAGRRGSFEGFDALPDPVDGPAGPLAGLVAALAEARDTGAEAVLVVAVDHPFVRRDTLRALAGMWDGRAVVPQSDGIRQVTCAVYPAGWHDDAHAELSVGGSIQSLLDRMPHRLVMPGEWAEWGEDGASWFSVDDAEALASGTERFGSSL